MIYRITKGPIGEDTARKLHREGKLPLYKLGKMVIYKEEDLLKNFNEYKLDTE